MAIQFHRPLLVAASSREIEKLKVSPRYVMDRKTSPDDRSPVLQVPAQNDLSRRFSVFLRVPVPVHPRQWRRLAVFPQPQRTRMKLRGNIGFVVETTQAHAAENMGAAPPF
ncbi:hypothetical protein ACU4GD_34010 [Cupriavidus basilensis]